MDKKIADYINKQKMPQKEIIEKIRKIFLKTIPDCDEKMAWGVITFSNNKFYIVGLKKHVHAGFAINGLNKEEMSQFEGNGKTMRHIKIETLKDIDEKKLVKLIKLVNKKAMCKPC
jgi:uncharacterized protein YdhG (YjbR/CyaY superfamily)